MKFQLFDRVKVKSEEKNLSYFTNSKPGLITNIDQLGEFLNYEVEFAAGTITARIMISEDVLEKVAE